MTDANATPSAGLGRAAAAAGQLAWDRSYLFVALFLFIALYIVTVKVTETLLTPYFGEIVERAIVIDALDTPIGIQIQERLQAQVHASPWVRLGGVDVQVLVLGRDGRTWLYVGGRAVPPPSDLEPVDILIQATHVLPASADVVVTVPHNALVSNTILLIYAAIFLQGLYVYTRITARRATQMLEEALTAREESSQRAAGIESELETVRQRLMQIEPAEREHGEEIRALQSERQMLHSKLSALASREEELRGKAQQAVELDQERRALEELLDEASGDLSSKEEEIRSLEQRLKRASRGSAAGPAKERESDLLARRLRTLYKTLEIDDRAISDIVGLRDESMKLKAESQIKSLADEADNVAIRRKVGGLPAQLSIFEIGFAGKGRIYYTKGSQRRFRILAVGAKNTQKTDLEYLSRISP